ncbi:undecaprenyldiphospho-muramoylpentapeptide beta-N-acetylglucosaminyltransferase [Desulfoluna butyratoxydans]|uniref:UDP-N-acetylglucosamine--N-acetylmuramyl-(pentapeptide) pyrophosphoryl-undecaprenol N-acetylglucosamine transferase n=1 Tax=Desulfoluna butyratoxydans TaxID=231438 RepID=A0A4U8YHK2_9BACT|nr:undecaprenyldiphospho-muramoylpentapeptide beta-N-acetylglucosaminyltransferase [Desulfoluna butyratoxydans]VFQ42449.1 n-acetylglucosaminyltransferase murg [Desulfoluna butyratoxydans]
MLAKKECRLVVAGGGTGGHLFPGIAIAKAFCRKKPGTRVLFIGTDKAFEKKCVTREGFHHTAAGASGIKGLGLKKKLAAAVKLPLSVVGCMVKLIRFRADAVVGVGGFSSGPVILAAWLLRRPVVLHEQNSVPGIANRLSARFAKKIYLTFPGSAAWFPEEKCILSGNPVREEILGIEPSQRDTASPTLLVVGGSQGAVALNRAVTEALPRLKAMGLTVIHQCGDADVERVKACYAGAEVNGEVLAFIDNMSGAYARADLVLCRAGATTLAELTAIGKGAVLVPFPHATDNHQEINARYLEDNGAARMILEADLTGNGLADLLEELLDNPEALGAMDQNAKTLGRPDASQHVAEGILDLTKKTT